MLQAGFIKEVRGLLEQGYTSDLPTMSAIGYREISAHLQGKLSLEEAVSQMKSITHQFVRRQANWFKLDDPEITWFTIDPDTVENMERVINEWKALANPL